MEELLSVSMLVVRLELLTVRILVVRLGKSY